MPSGALFADSVWRPSDVTNGSLENSHVAQLNTALQSMKSAADSDTLMLYSRRLLTRSKVVSIPSHLARFL